MLDEIMNEFYTVKLLETEGTLEKKLYTCQFVRVTTEKKSV